MSVGTMTGELKKMFEADSPLFKPAGEEALGIRKGMAQEAAARNMIYQVVKGRRCGVCDRQLGPGAVYLRVNAPGNYNGGTACDQCVKSAAKAMGEQA